MVVYWLDWNSPRAKRSAIELLPTAESPNNTIFALIACVGGFERGITADAILFNKKK